MTATAMPLAWVWVMIFPTSASMAAPLGIVCATAATVRQKAAKTTPKSGGGFCLVLTLTVRSELGPDIISNKMYPPAFRVTHWAQERSAILLGGVSLYGPHPGFDADCRAFGGGRAIKVAYRKRGEAMSG